MPVEENWGIRWHIFEKGDDGLGLRCDFIGIELKFFELLGVDKGERIAPTVLTGSPGTIILVAIFKPESGWNWLGSNRPGIGRPMIEIFVAAKLNENSIILRKFDLGPRDADTT